MKSVLAESKRQSGKISYRPIPNSQFPGSGICHNVTLSRLYKDGEQWRTSESFRRDDLPVVAKVVDQAHTWIFEKASQKEN